MTSLTWQSVLAWRMERQHLARRAPADALLSAVSRISGLHAQVMSSAELTAWARVEDLPAGAVARALWEERTLVKTWAQRGTLHLLPADELGLWVAAQAELRPRTEQPAWLRHHGLTADEAAAMLRAIAAALAGGEWLTRRELAERVASEAGVPALAEKLRGGFGDLLKPAAFLGELCFAPSHGQEVRFTSPAAWLRGAPRRAQDGENATAGGLGGGARRAAEGGVEGTAGGLPGAAVGSSADAAPEVARRWLAAYGPGTREQLARWFGTPSAAQAGRWIKALGDEAVEVDLEGSPAWMLAADVEAAAAASPSGIVRLVPAFDHYVVAAPRDASAVVPDEHRARVYRPQGWLSPVVLVDGVMAGVWSHELRGGRVTVTLEPFAPLGAEVLVAVEAEAARLARSLGAADVAVSC